MAKVQELQNEINCMNDVRDFKDAESVRSGQLSHVPSELAIFPLPTDPGGPLSRDRNPQPDIWNTHSFSGNVFANSPAYSSTPYSRMHSSWDVPAAGKIPVQPSTGQPVAESGDRDKDTQPTPRFLRSSPGGNSFNPMEERNFRNYVAEQQRF